MEARPLQDKVAIVTGGVRRIGRAIALALAGDGAAIVVNARSSAEEAEALRAEIETLGGRALVHLADVTVEAEMEKMVERAVATFGRLDILVNNAAIRRDTPFLDMSLAEWREVTGIVLDGAFLCARIVLPHMVQAGRGRIVNIGGVSAHLGAPNRAHVIAAKSGLVGLTRALAAEFAARGVTVNCVVPGKIGGRRSATSGHGIAARPLVSRDGVPEDVAVAVRHLCQPGSDYMTGQTLHVSGGMFMP